MLHFLCCLDANVHLFIWSVTFLWPLMSVCWSVRRRFVWHNFLKGLEVTLPSSYHLLFPGFGCVHKYALTCTLMQPWHKEKCFTLYLQFRKIEIVLFTLMHPSKSQQSCGHTLWKFLRTKSISTYILLLFHFIIMVLYSIHSQFI